MVATWPSTSVVIRPRRDDRSKLTAVAAEEFADDVERVRRANPLDLVVGEHLSLRPTANGQFKGSCPFCAEKFASLAVSPTIRGGRFHCFACGADGDVFDFVVAIDDLTYTRAVMRLAIRAGIDLTPPTQDQG